MAFFWDENGQGMVEYALIIAFISILLIGGLLLLRRSVQTTYYDTIESALSQSRPTES